MKRRNFPKAIKRQAARRAAGHCEICTAPLSYGQYHYDHIIPDTLGGEPDLANCQVLCLTCHRVKTTLKDAKTIAKRRRQRDAAIGIKTPRTITQWRKFDGTPVKVPQER